MVCGGLCCFGVVEEAGACELTSEAATADFCFIRFLAAATETG
jgi:hypothetical protein